jgi:hypothetical protein
MKAMLVVLPVHQQRLVEIEIEPATQRPLP